MSASESDRVGASAEKRTTSSISPRNWDDGLLGVQLLGSSAAQLYDPRAPMRRWFCGFLLSARRAEGSPGHEPAAAGPHM